MSDVCLIFLSLTLQIQNALRSFVELSERFPEHLQEAAKLSHPIDPTDETGKVLTVKDFAKVRCTFLIPNSNYKIVQSNSSMDNSHPQEIWKLLTGSLYSAVGHIWFVSL